MRRILFDYYNALLGTSLFLAILYLQHDRAKYKRGRQYVSRRAIQEPPKRRGRHVQPTPLRRQILVYKSGRSKVDGPQRSNVGLLA